MKAYLAQTSTELRLSLRQGEQLLVSIGIPLLLLVFFSLVAVLPIEGDNPVDVLAPGVIGLAVMSSALGGRGIATGFARHCRVR
jgi:ABC-2 type transport system permease protein